MAIFSTLSPLRSAGFRVLLGCAVTAAGLFWSSPAHAIQPTIAGVTPASVTYGVTTSQTVTLSGTNFMLGATINLARVTGTVDCLADGTDKCTLSGTTVPGGATELATAAKPFVYNSSGMLRFWWPNTRLAPGTYTVTVTNPAAAGGRAVSRVDGFTVVIP